jgi:hypothetical protein
MYVTWYVFRVLEETSKDCAGKADKSIEFMII